MNLEDAKAMIAERRDASPCLGELHRAVSLGRCRPIEPWPGRLTAGVAAGTYRIRRDTAAAAGVAADGIEGALEGLERREGDEQILLFHFRTEERLYTLFVAERDREVVGCISIEARQSP